MLDRLYKENLMNVPLIGYVGTVVFFHFYKLKYCQHITLAHSFHYRNIALIYSLLPKKFPINFLF